MWITLSISLHIYHFLLIKISTFNDGRTPILKSLNCNVNGNQCPEECKWQKWDDLLGLWQIDGTMRASCAGIKNIINLIVSKTFSYILCLYWYSLLFMFLFRAQPTIRRFDGKRSTSRRKIQCKIYEKW